MPIDVQKLALLRTISNALAERELVDVNLLLHEAGLSEVRWDDWYNQNWEPTVADKASTVLAIVRDIPRAAVDELALAVRELFEVSIEVHAGEEPEPLRLFASHLATQRAVVGAVGEELRRWGVELFVAHDSIEPDLEWQTEIERALRTTHAGIVFLFPGFVSSAWCDQEVGWLLGREVPCYALKFQGQDPYGPLGKKQAFNVRDEMTATEIASTILAWLATKPGLASNLNASFVEALKGSGSFRRTDQVWEHLKNATGMGPAQVAGVLTAIRDNGQVYNAHHASADGESGPYAELLFKLALEQPGFAANQDLAVEVARSRGLETLLPPTHPVEATPSSPSTDFPF